MFGHEKAQPALAQALQKMEEALALLDSCEESLVAAQLAVVIDTLKNCLV